MQRDCRRNRVIRWRLKLSPFCNITKAWVSWTWPWLRNALCPYMQVRKAWCPTVVLPWLEWVVDKYRRRRRLAVFVPGWKRECWCLTWGVDLSGYTDLSVGRWWSCLWEVSEGIWRRWRRKPASVLEPFSTHQHTLSFLRQIFDYQPSKQQQLVLLGNHTPLFLFGTMSAEIFSCLSTHPLIPFDTNWSSSAPTYVSSHPSGFIPFYTRIIF